MDARPTRRRVPHRDEPTTRLCEGTGDSLKPVGLGFAGVGGLGAALADASNGLRGFQVVAVQDVDGARAADVAGRHAAIWHGTDYSTLLAMPDVEAVVICTPNALHVPQTRAALLAGKHVLVQKPLALSPDGARAALE